MYMCQNHWHELKNARRQRGLWRRVTPAGYLAPEISEEILDICRDRQLIAANGV